jgi:hypothetical protein
VPAAPVQQRTSPDGYRLAIEAHHQAAATEAAALRRARAE